MKKISELCKHTFLSCEQYTELTSRSFDEKLSPADKVKCWTHHILCMVCRRFRRQLVFLEQAARRYEHTSFEDISEREQPLGKKECLCGSAKERIRENLSKSQ